MSDHYAKGEIVITRPVERKMKASVKPKFTHLRSNYDKATESDELMKHFLSTLRDVPDEYGLDFTGETVKITSLMKLEKFSPSGVDADLMLVSASNGQLFLVGVFRDEEADFY